MTPTDPVVVPITLAPGANACMVRINVEEIDAASADILTLDIQGSSDDQNWTTLATTGLTSQGSATLVANPALLPCLRYKVRSSVSPAIFTATAHSVRL